MRQLILCCVVALTLNFVAALPTGSTGPKAHCDLMTTTGNHLGRIDFTESLVEGVKAVMIEATLNYIELPDGPKGFHIHQFGKTGNNCADAGGHFNPHNMQHGSPLDHTNRHLGDLGNLHVQSKSAKLQIIDSRLKLAKMENDKEGIIGRSIVLHEMEDDLGKGNASDSKTTGAAGKRHACCIINETN